MLSNESSYEYAWDFAPLTGRAIAPKDAEPSKMVILLHGYQGDAHSNMNFARTLARSMPEALVVVPNGLSEVPGGGSPHVRQWWNLPSFEGRFYGAMPYLAPEEVRPGLEQIVREAHVCAGILNKFIRRRLLERGLSLRDAFLVGISQGGITAFEMALFRSELHKDAGGASLGALVVIGAGIPGAERLPGETNASIPPIPILLARGRDDEIFPPSVDLFSDSLLRENGLPVRRAEVPSGHFGLEHAAAENVCRFLNEMKAR